MNKRELIDKAVDGWLRVGKLVCVIANKQVVTVDLISEDNGVSCSNFKAYCRTELEPFGDGWVNGYRWGVEYPTNGKGPDLPADIKVEWTDITKSRTAEAGCLNWHGVTKFKIIDERYKPVNCGQTSISCAGGVGGSGGSELNKTSVTSDWYDYDRQEAIAPAPDKTRCEVKCGESYQRGMIIASHKEKCWFLSDCGGEFLLPFGRFHPLDHETRKAETDKKRVIDAACKAITNIDFDTYSFMAQCFSEAYDKGFLRMPEDK